MAADTDKAWDAPGGERLDGAARAEAAHGNLGRGESVGSGDGLHGHVLAGVLGERRGASGPCTVTAVDVEAWRKWRAESAPIGESFADMT